MVCLHVVCTWVKSLRTAQVSGSGPAGHFTNASYPEWEGGATSVLQMRCTHGDIKEYKMKWAELGIGNQLYHCKVGMVLQVDCAVIES